MTSDRRIVVTGLGVITPLGNDVRSYWEGLIQGRSGVDKITHFDTAEFEVKIAAEVKNFDSEAIFGVKEARKIDRFTQFAVQAAKEAVADAQLKPAEESPFRCGVIIGAGIGGIATIEEQHTIMKAKGAKRVSPLVIPKLIPNMAAGVVSIQFGFKGPNLCICSACASGTHAIGDAYQIIKRGAADVILTGGTESAITPLTVAGFQNMGALSKRACEPQKASCPFDKNRDGFVIGEGAGILILETLEHAQKRGARIYCEIIGYGLTGDAYHFTAPSPGGEGAAEAIKYAISQAQISPSDIDYINAHGTSTPLNDKLETEALKAAFGDHAYKLAISSNKSMIGHLLGAAGGVEFVATAKTLYEGIIPPTINAAEKDPECDLDYVPNQARPQNVRIALSNSMGFGGHNAVVIARKFES